MTNHNRLLTTISNKGTYVIIRTPPITTYTQGGDIDIPEIPPDPVPPPEVDACEYNISYTSTSGGLITATIRDVDGCQKILDDVEVGTIISITKSDEWGSYINVRIGVVEGDCDLAYDRNIEKGNGESKTVTITQPGKLVIELGGSVNYPKGGQYAVDIESSCLDYFVIDRHILYINDQFKVTCVKDAELRRYYFRILYWDTPKPTHRGELRGFGRMIYKPGDVCIGKLEVEDTHSITCGLANNGGTN